MSTHSSPFPSCFRPPAAAATTEDALPPPPPHHLHDNTNLTTCLYHSHLGIFSFTWSRTLFGRSLHLHLHPHSPSPSFDFSPSSSSLSFHLHMNNFFFRNKRGSQKLCSTSPLLPSSSSSSLLLCWDLSRAKFASGPEPVSGFYIAVSVDGELALLVGDLGKLACARMRARMPDKSVSQALFLRREHVFGNRVYHTTARIGAKNREISVDCNVNGDGRLSFCVDKERVLHVKRLKWKFRGNERVEFDGVSFQVSWDVYNWLFEDVRDGHAVFMFRFDKLGDVVREEDQRSQKKDGDKERAFTSNQNMLTWSQQPQSWSSCSFGMNEIELRKMRKSMPRASRSASSSSMSSSASSCGSNSSVMEWASAEENNLMGPVGFSLLVYAWKRR
ncbi:hypothetical protein MLD38_014576 [Melastoma candidum]|uniref:Uncharacterized protein n=1 Tax=Melastoma candidum TaxID=119954 RepID=A0ACB9RGC0_9MYRT|nr:hypothetical protein MLD38_014576 [Melastoma candidum]